MKFLRAFLLLLFLCTRTGAVAPNEQEEIQELYRRALAGDKDATILCIDRLEAVLQRDASNQLARVYLGSAYTLRSRDLPVGLTKWRDLRHGIDLMDQAAAAAPNDAHVALLRAVTNEAFPGLLGRGEIAHQALEQLVAQVEKNPAQLSPRDRQLLYLNAGEAAAKAGEKNRALELWQRGEALRADPKLTAEIEQARAAAK